METNRLRQFCTIVETGSLSAAAGLLNMTHSALSKSMKTLQQEVDQTLLQPAGRGLAVTEKGQEFYSSAKEFLAAEQRLFSNSQEKQGGHLKIGCPEIFLNGFVEAAAYGAFGERPLTLLDLEPGAMEHRVGQKQLDFAVTYAPHPSELVTISEIGSYPLGCYYLEGAFKEKTLEDLPFVVPAQGLSENPLGIKERDGWLEGLFPRKKAFQVNLLSVALDLTMKGSCAIYMPKFLAKKINSNRSESKKLVEFSLPSDLKTLSHKAFVIRHRHRPEDKEFKQLCSVVRKLMA